MEVNGVFIFICIVVLAVFSIVFYTIKNGISPMPSSSHAQLAVLKAIKQLPNKHNRVIIDAGSGWGNLAFQVASEFPGMNIFGLENSLIPFWFSRMYKMIGSFSNVTFKQQNIYTFSYEKTDFVLCYLYPGAMRQLSPILKQQLQNGAYIISIFFALPDWTPEHIMECQDLYRTKVYVYQKLH